MRDGGAIRRPVQGGSPRERVFDLSAGTGSSILSKRAEVRVRAGTDAKLRDALLQRCQKFVVVEAST
jgi:hypothetical protein